MDFSDVLATTALIVSGFSVWLSHKANRESTLRSERETQREFGRERSEFLIRIERATKTFERIESRISDLLASIDGQSPTVQSSMGDVAQKLRCDLNYLQGCLRQSRSLWHENFEMSHDGLAHHNARHLALLEDDEKFAAEAMDRADNIEKALNISLFVSNPVIG